MVEQPLLLGVLSGEIGQPFEAVRNLMRFARGRSGRLCGGSNDRQLELSIWHGGCPLYSF